MFGKHDGWDDIFGDDPLGFKRDAVIKAREGKSLSSMDLFSGLDARQQIELDGLVKGDGSIDKLGLVFSSFNKANEHESELSKSMKTLASSSILGSSTDVESRYYNSRLDDPVEEYEHDSTVSKEIMEFFQTEYELEASLPVVPEVTLSLSEQVSDLKALDRHNAMVFCPNLVEGAYTEQTITSAAFSARLEREKHSRSK
ncbi:hypothetical protein F0Z19_3844 [Vibrio cyclitrophicus]|nr:hypothetical protein F0Z19_3844 [Vibrio cyclitrophicus]